MPAGNALVLASDDRFGPAFLTTLGSVLAGSQLEDFNIYLFHDRRTDMTPWLDRARELCRRFDFPPDHLQSKPVDVAYFEERIRQPKNKSLNYARLYIPDLLEERTVVYLDVDVLVLKDLSELIRLDLCGHPIAAVRDHFNPTHASDGYFYRGEPASAQDAYFNSGVLVMDRARCAEADLLRHFESVQRELDRPRYNDQTFLNIVFKNDWHPLPAEWNVQTPPKFPASKRNDYAEIALLHFVTGAKPWKEAHVDLPNVFWHAMARALGVEVPEVVATALEAKLKRLRILRRLRLTRFRYLMKRLFQPATNRHRFIRCIRDLETHQDWMDDWLTHRGLAPVPDRLRYPL